MGMTGMATDLTHAFWERFAAVTIQDLPAATRTVASHCILDWTGCALAGSREALSEILRAEFATVAGKSSVVGTDLRTGATQAALVNGAAGHALDFDDTHASMGGHPSVAILPAALAVVEDEGRSGADLLTAFVVGVELACRLGTAIGPAHYIKGWHVTSTIGVFGAAAAAAKLLGLDAVGFGAAMGLAASQSSGLKANFGTMTKPFHAGRAAQSGVVAARLAARGFTANPNAFSTRQGLVEAAGSGEVCDEALAGISDRWLIDDTLFKYHAACYLTHAAIEATATLRDDVLASELETAIVTVHPALLDVCAIAQPKTGLEAKFSLAATVAMTLLGDDTADPSSFNDARVREPEVQALIDRVQVVADERTGVTESGVKLQAHDGTTREASCDTGVPASDLEAQGRKLRAKYLGLARPVLGERAEDLARRIENLAGVEDAATLFA
jgi:2-methylcitrate dehydratase PrpD